MKSLGRHALKGGLAVAQDVASGQDLTKSLKTRGKETGKAVIKDIVSDDQSGSGQKGTKRRSRQKPATSRKTKKLKTSQKQELTFSHSDGSFTLSRMYQVRT
jgi:hypothetical protein